MLIVWPHNLWASALVAIGLTLCLGVSVTLIEVVFANEVIARDRLITDRGRSDLSRGWRPTRELP
jgi:hypothetical protein